MRQIEQMRTGMDQKHIHNFFNQERSDTLGNHLVYLGKTGDSRLTKQFAKEIMANEEKLKKKELVNAVLGKS